MLITKRNFHFIFLIFILHIPIVFGQLQNNNWVFGFGARVNLSPLTNKRLAFRVRPGWNCASPTSGRVTASNVMQYVMGDILIHFIFDMGHHQMSENSSVIWNCPPLQNALCGWRRVFQIDGRGFLWTISSTRESCSLRCTFAKRWGTVLCVPRDEDFLLRLSRGRKRMLLVLSNSGELQGLLCFTTRTIALISLRFRSTTPSRYTFFRHRRSVLSG